MNLNYYLRQAFRPVYRCLIPRLKQTVLRIQSITRLTRVIRRSGRDRAFWVLSYIENIQGGYLSYKCKLPLDKYGNPLPWYTYPAIEYLQQYDFSACHIFEFGSGNSSKFWSSRACAVTSVEFDPQWYRHGIQELSSNQQILLDTDKNDYVKAIHKGDINYDVIVIDGKYRYNCAVEAIKKIKTGGVIILDNSDWFPNTAQLLRDNELTQVDFIGAGPINSYTWCTSVFFKEKIAIPRLAVNTTVKVLGGLVQVSDEDRYVD